MLPFLLSATFLLLDGDTSDALGPATTSRAGLLSSLSTGTAGASSEGTPGTSAAAAVVPVEREGIGAVASSGVLAYLKTLFGPLVDW